MGCAGGPAYYTPKKVLPFAFFNLPGLINREGIISQKILTDGITDLGILISQNKYGQIH